MNDQKQLKIQQLIAAAKRDKVIYKELLEAGEIDKPGYNERMQQCHEENADLLEAFLDQYGWPFPNTYGIEAHEAAWFIAIHAIARPQFVKKVARILEQAWKEGKISGKYFANFYDRIALYEGRKQRYGTHLFPSKHGWQVMSLEDPAQVDERRASVGLQSLKDWIAECEADETGYRKHDEDEHEREFITWCKEVGWRK
jgi:hypothetical protein